MLKLPNSIEPAVMAENIVHLRDGLAAVDAKTLPATTSATTGQILKLTGETKTPAWADEYSYTPPAYSETETATGQKWIDGKYIYCKCLSGNFPEITSVTTITVDQNLIYDSLINIYGYSLTNDNETVVLPTYYRSSTHIINIIGTSQKKIGAKVGAGFSEMPYLIVAYYTKPDPTPGRAPEDLEATPEEKKTTKKKTTK